MSDTPRFNSQSVRKQKVPRYYFVGEVGRAAHKAYFCYGDISAESRGGAEWR